ncbi:hypothetical protein V2W45_1467815 [Cenococcum geophilum]
MFINDTKPLYSFIRFKNINVIVIYSKKRSNKSIIIVNVNLEHIKNKEKNNLPIFYIVSHILAVSVNIFNLKVPAYRDILYPFFCDVSYITRGSNIIKEKAFLYAKYRNIFIRLGLITGFKEALELY